jgi:membrane protease YdiL (CAAX protease family)
VDQDLAVRLDRSPKGLGLFVARMLILAPRHGHEAPYFGAAAFAGAGGEELLFRAILPSALTQILNESGYRNTVAFGAAQLTSQSLFSLAHFAGSNSHLFDAIHFPEALRLLAVGLFLAIVVSLCGLWIAIAFHAFSNVDLTYIHEWTPGFPALPEIAACLVAAFVLVAVTHRGHLRPCRS